MKKINPYLFVIARESRGLSQIELAKSINLDQAHLSRIEQGIISNPSSEILSIISKELEYPIEFFYQTESVVPVNDFFYRKKLTLPAKDKHKLEARIEIIRLMYDKLVKPFEIPPLKLPDLLVNANFTPSDVAAVTREYFGIKRGPVKNLINILEKHGIAVIYITSTSQKFDAITIYTEKNYPLIILNKNMPNDRKRFSLAHELGHQIMHLPFRYDFEIYERIRADADSLENEADLFASEFLIPSSESRNDLINLNYQKLSQLKQYWNVSKRAIVYKAKQVNSIDNERYKHLMIELSRRGERVIESFDVEIDDPKIVSELFKAYKDYLKYNIKDIANVFKLNESDTRAFFNDNSNSKLRVAV